MRTKARRWFPVGRPALSMDPMSSARPMLLERPPRAPRTTAPRRQPAGPARYPARHDPAGHHRPARHRPPRHRRPRGRRRALSVWLGGAAGTTALLALWPGLLPALAAQARAHSDPLICTVLLGASLGAVWRMNREV